MCAHNVFINTPMPDSNECLIDQPGYEGDDGTSTCNNQNHFAYLEPSPGDPDYANSQAFKKCCPTTLDLSPLKNMHLKTFLASNSDFKEFNINAGYF